MEFPGFPTGNEISHEFPMPAIGASGHYRCSEIPFVFPISKQKFIEHAKLGDSVFTDLGALRVVECWADDVTEGKVTDFGKAVQAKPNESVVFSWIEWPDKETRDTAMQKMMSDQFDDERMDPDKPPPPPFDGKRLIYGGFKPIVEL